MNAVPATRPWLLRLLPPRLRLSVYARWYRRRADLWPQLYARAPLHFAPQLHMLDLSAGDVIGDYLAFTGIYELAASRRILELGRSGGVMIDVGANLGYFSMLFAQTHPDNRVHAFEASPRIARQLRANIVAAGLQARVVVHECAVAEAAGMLRFDPGPPEQTGWGGLSASGVLEVPTRRIDECVPADQAITLLKIDIEGADTWALRSAAALFDAGGIGEVWFEQHRPRMRALGIAEHEAADWLTAYGYDLHARDDPRSDLVEWIAKPTVRTRN